MPDTDVLIVGAGLAGLACARHLHRHNVTCQVLEASDDVGGRVRTDEVEGFTLDRGFQVLQTAYPEARRQLDYDALDLRPFYDGAMIHFDERFHCLADPFRHLLSNVAPSYAPDGQALLSVTLVDAPPVPEDTLRNQVRGQLARWFGARVGTWRHLRTYRITYALPDQSPPYLSPPERPVRCRPGLYVCGDHRATASIHGALLSGRHAAEAVLEDLA